MVESLIMSAKLASLSLLKRKIFWNKGYDVKISANNITNKILSRDSIYIVDVVLWAIFGNCNTSMREVIITSHL